MSDLNQASPYVVGLTGGIASGKTTVSDRFHYLGVDVIDADVVARQVVEPGQPALVKLRELFGGDILNGDGTLNRQAMREKMFADADLRQATEQVLHPIIREQMWQQVSASQTPYCILAVPLLMETGGHKRVHRVLVVDVDETTQIERLMARDNSDMEEVRAILAAQSSREQRLSIADDVIDNSRDLEHLYRQVSRLHKMYLDLAGQFSAP